MSSPSPPLPEPGRAAADSKEIKSDPASSLHVVVDIPDTESPTHSSVVVDETTDAADAPPRPRAAAAVAGKAAAAKQEEEEEDGIPGCCSGKIFLAFLCVWLGGHVLAFFILGVATGNPQVLLLAVAAGDALRRPLSVSGDAVRVRERFSPHP